jgi:hypothetical protein
VNLPAKEQKAETEESGTVESRESAEDSSAEEVVEKSRNLMAT